MNHKRRRPKHQRAGCLICKPHKDERGKRSRERDRPAVRRAKIEDDELRPCVVYRHCPIHDA